MKILSILGSGLGNGLLFSPTMRVLREKKPEATLDLYVYKPLFAAPYRGSDLIDSIFVHEGMKTIFSLHHRQYDVSLTGFPSNRWQHNVFTRLVGAKRRIIHDYPVGYWTTFRCLQTDLVSADPSLHDVEQNLRLLDPLDLSYDREPPDPLFHLDPEHRERARAVLDENDLSDAHRIGIHPGSGPLTWKRAPLDQFLRHIENHRRDDSAVLIFGGPDEEEIKTQAKKRIEEERSVPILVLRTPIKETAALIETCDVFLSNDTGLSHVAAALDVPEQTVLFHGTDPTRTRPWREDAEIVQLEDNRMEYPYERTTTGYHPK